MGIFSKLKQAFLNQSDMYRFYECEYKKNSQIKKERKNEKRIKK